METDGLSEKSPGFLGITFPLSGHPIPGPEVGPLYPCRASNVVPLGFLNLAGEDFAHYMEHIPGCFLRIGARESGGAVIPAHASTFYPAEESLFVGASVRAECARVASAALASSG